MTRILQCLFAFLVIVGFGLGSAHAERWLRVLEKDPNRGGKFAWFDVDSVVHEAKAGLLLVHSTVLTVKGVKSTPVKTWRLWGFDCKGQKAYRVGASEKGVFAQAANWQTDPKATYALAGNTSDRVVTALGAKLCAWSDAWPPGTIQ